MASDRPPAPAANEWIVFRVTDISVPPVDLASDDMKKLKETLQRGLTDEQVAQYVTRLETDIGTTINQAAFAQVTGGSMIRTYIPIEEFTAMDDLKSIIGKVATGATLSRDEAASAFDSMMSGEATPSQMGGLLMALRVRGETVDEITGAVSAMRAKMLRVKAPADAVDVVGTGGDGSGSVNVSTCASFIVAGAGVPVAKHGNRALSSRSGAADVLSSLGRQDRHHARSCRPLRRGGRDRLHVRAVAPSRDEERRSDPRRTGDPHDLQSAGAAVQSGRRHAANGRGIFKAMGAAAGAGAEKPRRRIGLGGARLRRPR